MADRKRLYYHGSSRNKKLGHPCFLSAWFGGGSDKRPLRNCLLSTKQVPRFNWLAAASGLISNDIAFSLPSHSPISLLAAHMTQIWIV